MYNKESTIFMYVSEFKKLALSKIHPQTSVYTLTVECNINFFNELVRLLQRGIGVENRTDRSQNTGNLYYFVLPFNILL